MSRNNDAVSQHFSFPNPGGELNGLRVIDADINLTQQRWRITFDGNPSRRQLDKALSNIVGKTKLFPGENTDHDVTFASKYDTHRAKTNPPYAQQTMTMGDVIATTIIDNPCTEVEFEAEFEEMTLKDPDTHFRKKTFSGGYKKAKFRKLLWSTVTNRGESYGWVTSNKDLWHRRASLFMPKLKINKFVKGAKAFYHTHPSKDEPSLTSADDYQWYVDCAFAYGIKDYYTVMDERMDFFCVTVNEKNREDYLKLDEDTLAKDIDSVIDKHEKAVDERHKDDDSMPDHIFFAEITRKTVQDLNSRFKRYFTITYTPYKRPDVRENPGSDAGPLPNRPTRIEDKYVAAALDELKGLDYSFVHYGGDEYAHTVYVYWWLRHHLVPTADYPKGRSFKWADYGMDSPHRAKLRDYLDEEVQPGWTNLDMLLLLGVYHDVGKLREKESGIHHSVEGANMWRDEIAPELGISGPLAENIEFMLQSDVGRRDIDVDAFRRMVGDYYGVALLLQMVDMNVHHPLIFTGAAGIAKREGHISRSSPEEYLHFKNGEFMTMLNTFLDNRPMSNPPAKVKSLNYVGSYETPIDGYLAKESLAEWDATKVLKIEGKSGTPKYGNTFLDVNGSMLHLRWPVSDEDSVYFRINLGNGTITMMFKEEQFSDDFGGSLADEIFYTIGEKLNELGAVEPIELEKQPQPEPLVNPRRAKNVQVITVSGPSGSGKTTISRYIARSLDAHIAPSYTTRAKRPKEKPGDRKFITHEQFLKMIEDGKMVEWQKQKNGHYYGRTFADMGAAPTVVVDTTIGGAMRIRDAFPNTFSVFLKPDVDEDTLAKRIYRRGGMGKGEAKGRAKAAMNMVEAAQHMPFDIVIESRTSYYDDVAEEILKQIPLKNPGEWLTLNTIPLIEETPTIDVLYEKVSHTGDRLERAAKHTGRTEEEILRQLRMEWLPRTVTWHHNWKNYGLYGSELFPPGDGINNIYVFYNRSISRLTVKTITPDDFWTKEAHKGTKYAPIWGTTGPHRELLRAGKTPIEWAPPKQTNEIRKSVTNALRYDTDRTVRVSIEQMLFRGMKPGLVVKTLREEHDFDINIAEVLWFRDDWLKVGKEGGKSAKYHIEAYRFNPPHFHYGDEEKRKARWETTTTLSGETLMRQARAMAKKRGYTVSVKRFKTPRSFPEKTERELARYRTPKMKDSVVRYLDWCENNVSRVVFSVKKKGEKVTTHVFHLALKEPPASVKNALRTIEKYEQTFPIEEVKKTQRWYLRLPHLPFMQTEHYRFDGEDEHLFFDKNYALGIAHNLLEKPFRPFAHSLGGGEMKEKTKKTGVYSILKTYEAGWAEKNEIELFSAGQTFPRTDMYRSYGWLNNFDYTEWTPYESKAAKSHLEVGDFEAGIDAVWRPVWAKAKKNPQKTLDDEVLAEDEIDRKLRIHNLIKKGYIPWEIPEWLNRGILPADAPLGRNDDEVMLTNEQMLAIEDSEVYKEAYEAHKKEKADAAKAYRDEWNIKKLGDFNNPPSGLRRLPYIPFCQQCKDYYNSHQDDLPRQLDFIIVYDGVTQQEFQQSRFMEGLSNWYRAISKGGELTFHEYPLQKDEIPKPAHSLREKLGLPLNTHLVSVTDQPFTYGGYWAMPALWKFKSLVDHGDGSTYDQKHLFVCFAHEMSAHYLLGRLPHYKTHQDLGWDYGGPHCPNGPKGCINGYVNTSTPFPGRSNIYPAETLRPGTTMSVQDAFYQEYIPIKPGLRLSRTKQPGFRLDRTNPIDTAHPTGVPQENPLPAGVHRPKFLFHGSPHHPEDMRGEYLLPSPGYDPDRISSQPVVSFTSDEALAATFAFLRGSTTPDVALITSDKQGNVVVTEMKSPPREVAYLYMFEFDKIEHLNWIHRGKMPMVEYAATDPVPIELAEEVYEIRPKDYPEITFTVKTNPPPSGLAEDFENMKSEGRRIYSSGQDGLAFWGEQKPLIVAKYGGEAIEGAVWRQPLWEHGFDAGPDGDTQDFKDGKVTPLHFLNQLRRIPINKPLSPERILQVAYNIGQGMAAGSVTQDYRITDFVTFETWSDTDWSESPKPPDTIYDVEWNPRRIPKPMAKGVTIYGAEWCPACKKAKAHMKKNKVKHRYYDIKRYKYYDEVIGPLTEDYEYIPAIFVDGEFIGGYSDYIEGGY